METQVDSQYKPVCLCTNLRRATRAISNLYDAALAPSGIKITQFSLLRAVERNEPVAITALADEMALDRTTLARNLAPLERDRLVELAPGSDQRVTEVRLTRAGRNKIAAALPLWKKTQADVGRLLSDGRIEQLRDIASDVSAAAESFASKRRR
ncbi:MAG TPA: MarR family winged helix-turn-helix transcriptional regulator [Rudaea sp.]|jgi:DNA-binding MarR family transcriptional regulator|nr:MarR family winged helix-turn-helix transcriptional regulator [Rudaea sp.]